MNSRLIVLAALTIAVSGSAAGSERTGTNLRIGVASVELEATDEMPLVGGITPAKATGQDGILRAVATVIQGPPDGTRVVIVVLDVLAIARNYLDEAARQIELETGIPFDHVIISSTHTHHAPGAMRFHDAPETSGFGGQVRNAAVEAASRANTSLVSSPTVDMRFIMGSELTVGQNSRIELRDGTISWVLHPATEWLRTTGPFDPDFPVIAFKRPDQSLAAVIFGHSTHTIGTRNPESRSPGFYGLAAQEFERETGALTTFISGASGSTHAWQIDGEPFSAVSAERRILNALRYHVDQARPVLVARLGSMKREITVRVRDFDEMKEDRAVRTYLEKYTGNKKDAQEVADVFRRERAELASHRGERRTTWVSATRIGDVAIVGVPAELFAQLGLDIKQRSPFPHTFIAELANDYIGYVANADAYRLGGYQVWMGQHSWTERGTGEQFVNEAVQLLDELYMQ